MKKQKLKKVGIFSKLKTLPVLIAIAVFAFSAFGIQRVMADRFQDEINALNAQNAQSKAAQSQLQQQAASLAGVIAGLQSQIAGLEAQIRDNQAKNDSVTRQIAEAEAELARQKKLLGENIKQMYLEDKISTLEMLASSKDLSEFVDKQQYRNAVKDKIKTTLDKITALKLELKSQKETLEKLIADQKVMQGELAAQRAENNRLLSLNKAEQASYEGQIKTNNTKIAELRRLQAIENAKLFGSTPGTGVNCGGGYPGSANGPWGKWGCNYPLDYSIDNWGMYNRECVSYTAFKVAASGRHMPYWGGRGNAKNWDDNARAAGIPVDQNPRSGDVAVSNAGTYGHVLYVEHVGDDGGIYVSDYNQQWDGRYREYWISESTWRARSLVFIHF